MEMLKRNALDPSFGAVVKVLKEKVEKLLQANYKINGDERGNWGHYHYCAHDGARLQFHWSSPNLHVCPVCSEKWLGEAVSRLTPEVESAGVSIGIENVWNKFLLSPLEMRSLHRRYRLFGSRILSRRGEHRS